MELVAQGVALGEGTFSVSTSAVNIAAIEDRRQVGLSTAANQAIVISGFEVDYEVGDPGWLTGLFLRAEPQTTINVSGMELKVDRSSLPDGIYEARVSIEALNAPAVSVDVRVAVGEVGGIGAPVEVVLVDPITEAVRHLDIASDELLYEIEDVEAGTYLLYAWSDLNSNGAIDAGDLYGAYPQLDAPVELTIERGDDLTGVDVPLDVL